MRKTEKRGKRRLLWGLIYTGAFLAAFAGSAVFKMTYDPLGGLTKVDWSDAVGTVYTDIPYGEGPANKFDLYLPAGQSDGPRGLVVYLHAGGFTSGDKADDAAMLKWLCSKGYAAAGVNYTLASEEHPGVSVYTQSVEIRESIPAVVAKAAELGCPVDRMAIAGGSAGHTLAMLYAYRDADTAPVPVKMVFGAVGPSCFYPEDWGCYGLDRSDEAAAALFGAMAGRTIDPAIIGTPAYDEAVRDISAAAWVDENSVPSLFAYGAYDKIQAFPASQRLAAALEEHGVPYDSIVFPHSGHGLQNDNKQARLYYRKINEYLDAYLR